jgi:hypothetical protein
MRRQVEADPARDDHGHEENGDREGGERPHRQRRLGELRRRGRLDATLGHGCK